MISDTRFEIKSPDGNVLIGKKNRGKFFKAKISCNEKEISTVDGIGNLGEIEIARLPNFTDVEYNPRRKPTELSFRYQNVTLRKKVGNPITVRFRLYPELKTSEWKKPYNIDTYFKRAKEIFQSRNDIRFTFFSNEAKFIQILVLDIVLIVDINKDDSIADVIIKASKEIESVIEKTDGKLDIGARFKSILEIWDSQSNLDDEEYWHKLLSDNSWIISHSLSMPELLFTSKAYLGGKNIGNTKGRIVDLTFKNLVSSNISLIELKTPETKLVGQRYRSVYSISKELSGSVNQLLDYRETASKYYGSLVAEAVESYKIFSPNLLLIIGDTSKLSETELYSFELYRRELRNIQIIGYNELFQKIEMLYELLNKRKFS